MTKVMALGVAALATLGLACGSAATSTHAADRAALRQVPAPLFGVTINHVSAFSQIVASARRLSHRPTTRIYFDVMRPPGYYAKAIRALHADSYLMGELLDSSEETAISTSAFEVRTKSYLRAFGAKIDIWEVGNEVNGNWLGNYRTVSAKLTQAYRAVAARHLRTALTLYYNAGCGDGSQELSPIAFTRTYVPAAVRDGLTYVLVSYYEDSCRGIRPSAGQWTSFFKRLHTWYPHARLGFGEIGMGEPATRKTLAPAKALMAHYYGLKIDLPYYIGGYFWWYYAEDCVPSASKPLWSALDRGFEAEASAG
ncbi:MAG TPA: hypothetical protein VEV63_12985 [Streptosporangiaceae bacterium]|nr:hypothetical protein [Streptosporangiaceae bacterium]